MQESKFYQLMRERIVRETTIKHISTVLKARFSVDIVNALMPVIQKITDLQRLEQLLLKAPHVQSIEAFKHLLNE